MSEEEAARFALISMSEIERKVILRCDKKTTIGYRRISQEIGESYTETQKAGRALQNYKLAHVSTFAAPMAFNGSGIFLNDRGVLVRAAVSKLMSG